MNHYRFAATTHAALSYGPMRQRRASDVSRCRWSIPQRAGRCARWLPRAVKAAAATRTVRSGGTAAQLARPTLRQERSRAYSCRTTAFRATRSYSIPSERAATSARCAGSRDPIVAAESILGQSLNEHPARRTEVDRRCRERATATHSLDVLADREEEFIAVCGSCRGRNARRKR